MVDYNGEPLKKREDGSVILDNQQRLGIIQKLVNVDRELLSSQNKYLLNNITNELNNTDNSFEQLQRYYSKKLDLIDGLISNLNWAENLMKADQKKRGYNNIYAKKLIDNVVYISLVKLDEMIKAIQGNPVSSPINIADQLNDYVVLDQERQLGSFIYKGLRPQLRLLHRQEKRNDNGVPDAKNLRVSNNEPLQNNNKRRDIVTEDLINNGVKAQVYQDCRSDKQDSQYPVSLLKNGDARQAIVDDLYERSPKTCEVFVNNEHGNDSGLATDIKHLIWQRYIGINDIRKNLAEHAQQAFDDFYNQFVNRPVAALISLVDVYKRVDEQMQSHLQKIFNHVRQYATERLSRLSFYEQLDEYRQVKHLEKSIHNSTEVKELDVSGFKHKLLEKLLDECKDENIYDKSLESFIGYCKRHNLVLESDQKEIKILNQGLNRAIKILYANEASNNYKNNARKWFLYLISMPNAFQYYVRNDEDHPKQLMQVVRDVIPTLNTDEYLSLIKSLVNSQMSKQDLQNALDTAFSYGKPQLKAVQSDAGKINRFTSSLETIPSFDLRNHYLQSFFNKPFIGRNRYVKRLQKSALNSGDAQGHDSKLTKAIQKAANVYKHINTDAIQAKEISEAIQELTQASALVNDIRKTPIKSYLDKFIKQWRLMPGQTTSMNKLIGNHNEVMQVMQSLTQLPPQFAQQYLRVFTDKDKRWGHKANNDSLRQQISNSLSQQTTTLESMQLVDALVQSRLGDKQIDESDHIDHILYSKGLISEDAKNKKDGSPLAQTYLKYRACQQTLKGYLNSPYKQGNNSSSDFVQNVVWALDSYRTLQKEFQTSYELTDLIQPIKDKWHELSETDHLIIFKELFKRACETGKNTLNDKDQNFLKEVLADQSQGLSRDKAVDKSFFEEVLKSQQQSFVLSNDSIDPLFELLNGSSISDEDKQTVFQNIVNVLGKSVNKEQLLTSGLHFINQQRDATLKSNCAQQLTSILGSEPKSLSGKLRDKLETFVNHDDLDDKLKEPFQQLLNDAQQTQRPDGIFTNDTEQDQTRSDQLQLTSYK